MAGVGTQKVFENDRVIVWHLDLEPAEQGQRHMHELDYVVRVRSRFTTGLCRHDVTGLGLVIEIQLDPTSVKLPQHAFDTPLDG